MEIFWFFILQSDKGVIYMFVHIYALEKRKEDAMWKYGNEFYKNTYIYLLEFVYNSYIFPS